MKSIAILVNFDSFFTIFSKK